MTYNLFNHVIFSYHLVMSSTYCKYVLALLDNCNPWFFVKYIRHSSFSIWITFVIFPNTKKLVKSSSNMLTAPIKLLTSYVSIGWIVLDDTKIWKILTSTIRFIKNLHREAWWAILMIIWQHLKLLFFCYHLNYAYAGYVILKNVYFTISGS